MIGAQFVAVAFTITVRKRVHYKVEETWRARTVCSEGVKCPPLERFLNSEMTLIILFGGFLLVQVSSSTNCVVREEGGRFLVAP